MVYHRLSQSQTCEAPAYGWCVCTWLLKEGSHDFFMNLVLLTQCLIIMSNLKMSLEGWVVLVLFLLAEILSLLAPLTA